MSILFWKKKKDEKDVDNSMTGTSSSMKNMLSGKGHKSIIGQYFTLEDLQPVVCGSSGIILSPLSAAQLADKNYYTVLNSMWSLSPNVKRFLPYLDFSSESKVKDFMFRTCVSTEQGMGFCYVITLTHIPAGLFLIETPYLNKGKLGYENWTMDFLLFNPFEGNGIMSVALPRMLLFLQGLDVDNIHLLVDKDNSRCLNLISQLPIDEIDNSNWQSSIDGSKPRLFNVPLSTIRFK